MKQILVTEEQHQRLWELRVELKKRSLSGVIGVLLDK